MIRVATEEDFPALIKLGEIFANKLGNMPLGTTYTPEDVEETLVALTEDEDSTIFLYEEDGKLLGMLGVTIFSFFFDMSARKATELFFYVDEEARSRGAGSLLMEEAMVWAKGREANSMSMVAININAPTNANEVFLKYGFREFETTYRVNL